jgi:glucose/arabinose dehydrogenase
MRNTLYNKSKISLIFATSVFYLVVFIGIYFFRNEIKELVEQVKYYKMGATNYINQRLDGQMGNNNLRAKEGDRVIETSTLPLRLKTIQIRDFVSFASEGGALTIANGRLLVMDRLGSIFLYEAGEFKKIPTPKIPNRINEFLLKGMELNSNIMRVHSIAFDNKKSRLYVSFTRYISKKNYRLVIASLALNASLLSTEGEWFEVYESDDTEQMGGGGSGGKLFIDGRQLLFSVGSPDSIGYKDEWKEESYLVKGDNYSKVQDKKSSFGKIYEYGLDNQKIQLKSFGHRNVQGLTEKDNKIYAVEHGPQGGDEINIIKNGKNYGWPIKTFGTRYGTYDFNGVASKLSEKGYTDPVYSFVPSIGTSSIEVLNSFHERWNGDFLVGSLKAQSLYRIHMGDMGNVIFSEPIYIGHRIRDISAKNDEITLLTDDALLISIKVDNELLKKNQKGDGISLQIHPKLQRCITCHSFEPSNSTSLAPTLKQIIGKKVGSDNFDGYSEALKNTNKTWNEGDLVKFLLNPQKQIPGTKMPNPGVSEAQAIEITKILSRQ